MRAKCLLLSLATLLWSSQARGHHGVFGGGCSDPCGSAFVIEVQEVCAPSSIVFPPIENGSVTLLTPSANCGVSVLNSGAIPAAPASAAPTSLAPAIPVPQSEVICDPVTNYKVVMQPTYVTEKRTVNVNKTRTETRYRTKTVYETIPVTETKYRQKVVHVPKSETKTVEYTVLVPVKSEKTVTLTEMVPSWKETEEQYTVQVPKLVEVPESYTVRVPKLEDETFTYTVNVPQAVTESRVRTVTNAVPVTKTRTVEYCVPVTKMQTVTKDFGHWETRLVEVANLPASTPSRMVVHATGCATRSVCCNVRTSRLRRCCTPAVHAASCGGTISPSCSPIVACETSAPKISLEARQVWVPNVKTETIPVTSSEKQEQVITYTVYEQQTEEVPYECTRVVYVPETRTGTRQKLVYVDELRTRTRKVVEYKDETRTRTRKELQFTPQEKTKTIPYVSYKSETRTKDVTYEFTVPEYTMEPYEVTRYDRMAAEAVEEYTVTVPYCETEIREVQVCKMVPKIIEETMNPCAETRVPKVQSGNLLIETPCGSCAPPKNSPCGC